MFLAVGASESEVGHCLPYFYFLGTCPDAAWEHVEVAPGFGREDDSTGSMKWSVLQMGVANKSGLAANVLMGRSKVVCNVVWPPR